MPTLRRALALALPVIVLACGPAPAPASPAPGASPVRALSPSAPSALPAASPAAAITMLRSPPAPGTEVEYALFDELAAAGREWDTFAAIPGGGTEAKAAVSYRDRGETIPLAARLAFGADGALREYAVWGRTSRGGEPIDDRAEARDGAFEVSHAGASARVKPDGVAVAASGFAPVLVVGLILRAWNQHGRPPKMASLPAGEVAIESRGKRDYDGESGKETLEHVAVRGLVAGGRLDAWLDENGELAAVVTCDTGSDPFEAARDGLESIVPQLLRVAATDGVAELAVAAKGAERSAPGVQAYVGANLIDGTGRPAVKDSVVVVDGDRIVLVGSRAKVTVPTGATIIDVSGKSIIPGLWDMHGHFVQVEQGAALLAGGVTTVRDLGNVLDFITPARDAIEAGKGFGPRVLVEGRVDGGGDRAWGTARIVKREDIAPTLDRLKKAGCIDVKVYSSLDPALVRPLVAAAHARGMRVIGHVPQAMTAPQAIDAGFDSLSHLHHLYDAAIAGSYGKHLGPAEVVALIASIDFAAPPMERELASLVTHHVAIDDTVVIYEGQSEGTPAVAKGPDPVFAKAISLIGELHRRGVTLLPGTDSGTSQALHRELELYVRAGFTPMEAIQAATLGSARYMHLEKELGTIEPGKRADMVVLNGDPLTDMSNVRKTALVVARGRAYDPAALWKLSGVTPKGM